MSTFFVDNNGFFVYRFDEKPTSFSLHEIVLEIKFLHQFYKCFYDAPEKVILSLMLSQLVVTLYLSDHCYRTTETVIETYD